MRYKSKKGPAEDNIFRQKNKAAKCKKQNKQKKGNRAGQNGFVVETSSNVIGGTPIRWR